MSPRWPLIVQLSFLGPVLKCEWHITPDDESWLTIVVFIGMCLSVAPPPLPYRVFVSNGLPVACV